MKNSRAEIIDLFGKQKNFIDKYARSKGLTFQQFFFIYCIRKHNINSILDLLHFMNNPANKIWIGNFSFNTTEASIRSFVHKLQREKEMLTQESEGRYSLFNLTDKAHQIMERFTGELADFLAEQDEKYEEREELSNALNENKLIINSNGNKLVSLDKLPNRFKELFEEDADSAYTYFLECMAANIYKRQKQTIRDKETLTSMPFFLSIPKKMKPTSTRYFSNRLNLISGIITGFSEIKLFNLGKLMACRSEDPHFKMLSEELGSCPHCNASMREISDVDLPVREISIETPDGERLKAYLHADLWQPKQTAAITQKFLIFKVKENSKFKRLTDIKYLIIGTEQKEEFEYNYNKAKIISAMPSKEIFDTLSNSLFSDIAGLSTLKRAALLSLASINTKQLMIDYGLRKTVIPGMMNTLYWGKPGTAKTKIIKVLTDIMGSKIAFGQAGGSTITSLTVAYDDKQKSLRMGAIPLNDTRCVLIDELDKFSKFDYPKLLEPAAERSLHINKGGLSGFFHARTVMFFTGNNKANIGSDIIEQLKKEIHRPLIDRMDIICVVKTVKSGMDILGELLTSTSHDILTAQEIKNYFEVIRINDKVIIEKDILEYLQSKLKKYIVVITARRLNTIYRIIGAYAKLHMRDRVNKEDVDEALSFYLETLETLGEISPEIVSQLESPTNNERHIDNVYTLIDKHKGIELEAIQDILELDMDNVTEIVNSLLNDGMIIELPKGFYKTIK